MPRKTKKDLEDEIKSLRAELNWHVNRNMNNWAKIRDLEEEVDTLRKEIDHKRDQLFESTCQIHFLAWMLVREWVHLTSYWMSFRWMLNHMWIQIVTNERQDG